MCLRPMLSVTRKLFQIVFLYLKESAWRWCWCWCWRHIAKRDAPVLVLNLFCHQKNINKDAPVLVLNLFCHQKNINKAYVKKYSVLVYLTKGYEGIRNKIDHLCLLQNFFTDRSTFWNYISNREEQVPHHLYRGHHMSSLSLVYL